MGDIPRIDWLDQMVFRKFEKRGLHAAKSSLNQAQRQQGTAMTTVGAAEDPGAKDGSLDRSPAYLLNVELPRFDFPVVFADQEYDAPPVSALQSLHINQPANQHAPHVQYGPGINALEDGPSNIGTRICRVYDAEIGQRDNPAETKHRRLFRSSHRHGILDKDLKPNAKVRDELNIIMSYSPMHPLSPEEMDLVWKFRYHLTKDKRALTKFVRSVNWNDQGESKQAIQVLGRWTEIDVDDALELLGPSFGNRAVRTYAVSRLKKAEDDELLLYLLQLVQALKYEHISLDSLSSDATRDSSLARFLIQRAATNFLLGNYFYWYLMVECDDGSPEQGTENRNIYRKVAYDFMVHLAKQPAGNEERKTLLRQAELIAILSRIAEEVKLSSDTMSRRLDRVKAFIADPKNELLTFDPPLSLPLDPSIKITGVVPDQTAVFKSSLSPIKCAFMTTKGDAYPIIFKVGDDLRQDQLVIQIITLMDQLLQKENLDLKLLPYKILAISTTAGASQFIQSQSLSSIVGKFKNNPALAYLRHHNPDKTQALGVRHETLDTYVWVTAI
ncbi:Phosphatidylinositol (PI) 3-kinase [Lecanicillium sp. MT-2017a]|nr:Phosphatidylinositol (PI) 3-kinase [Lecanicillium sp. MT-2017a]